MKKKRVTMKFRARHALIAAVAVSALALTACSGTGDDGGGGGEDVPQTFAVSSNYPITSLDSYGQYSADGGLLFVAKQIYDTLIVSDGKGGYTGHLAESWEPERGRQGLDVHAARRQVLRRHRR